MLVRAGTFNVVNCLQSAMQPFDNVDTIGMSNDLIPLLAKLYLFTEVNSGICESTRFKLVQPDSAYSPIEVI